MFSLENNVEEIGPPGRYGNMHVAHPFFQILAPGATSTTAGVLILPSQASGPAVAVHRLSGYCCVVLCVSAVLQEMLERCRILRLTSLSTETDLSLHK